jgi:hypothetical protein
LGVNCLAQGQNNGFFHLASSGIRNSNLSVTSPTILTTRLHATFAELAAPTGNLAAFQQQTALILQCLMGSLHQLLFLALTIGYGCDSDLDTSLTTPEQSNVPS